MRYGIKKAEEEMTKEFAYYRLTEDSTFSFYIGEKWTSNNPAKTEKKLTFFLKTSYNRRVIAQLFSNNLISIWMKANLVKPFANERKQKYKDRQDGKDIKHE